MSGRVRDKGAEMERNCDVLCAPNWILTVALAVAVV